MNRPGPIRLRLRTSAGAAARPIPAFLRAPTADEQAADARARLDRARDVLPALASVRDQVRQALTAGPVGLAERARMADLLDAAIADLHGAIYP